MKVKEPQAIMPISMEKKTHKKLSVKYFCYTSQFLIRKWNCERILYRVCYINILRTNRTFRILIRFYVYISFSFIPPSLSWFNHLLTLYYFLQRKFETHLLSAIEWNCWITSKSHVTIFLHKVSSLGCNISSTTPRWYCYGQPLQLTFSH